MSDSFYILDLGQFRDKTFKGSLGREIPEAKRVPKVIAKCVDGDTANLFAQSYSYTRHGNAIYGLFGILIGDGTEIERVARGYGGDTMQKIFAATASFH